MKISLRQLKQVIKEEIQHLRESNSSSKKVSEIQVGDVLVSTSGGRDTVVKSIRKNNDGTVTFMDSRGTEVTLGLRDPANKQPATTLVRI